MDCRYGYNTQYYDAGLALPWKWGWNSTGDSDCLCPSHGQRGKGGHRAGMEVLGKGNPRYVADHMKRAPKPRAKLDFRQSQSQVTEASESVIDVLLLPDMSREKRIWERFVVYCS